MPASRLILVTTELFAPGGVQQVSRQAMAAVRDLPFAQIEAWSLMDRLIPAGLSAPLNVRLRLARGDRWRLGQWAVGSALRGPSNTLVVLMHVNLAPLAVPFLARGADLAVFLHGVEAWSPLTGARRQVVGRASLLANSSWTAKRFGEANPTLAGRSVAVCPLGVDELSNAPATESADAQALALVVSRLSSEDRYKGHDRLLRAWPAVRARVPRAELLVVGDGDDRPRLEGLASDLGLAAAVSFAGAVSDEEIHRAFDCCSLFVLPSDREGFGLVFLEAMRAGKPCISGSGAPAEVVQDGMTGFVVPPDDDDSTRLVEVLIRLFEDRELRARLGANGRSRYLQSFTAAQFQARFREFVMALTAGRRAA